MATGRRPPRRRANPKFYIFIGIIAAAAVAAIFFLTNIQTAVVEDGTIPFETTVPVVVVRDEQIITVPNYGKVQYVVQEGERVEAETPVANVYKWGYNDQVMNDLIEIQTKIEQYQQTQLEKAGGDEQLASYNSQIAQKTAEVSGIIGGAEGSILAAERELKDLMAQKQQYLRDTVAADQQLQTYYDKEEQLKARVDNDWLEVMNAPADGVVSFYFDGMEGTLNAARIKEITSADVLDVLNGTTKSQQESSDEGAEKQIYRLVNNFKWYLVVRSDQEIPEFANDNSFSIAFDDYISRQYQGIVVGNVKEEDGYVYAIEIDDDIGELLNARRTDAKVYTQFTGLKVPEKALREEEGVTGVNVVVGREKTFVPVTVKIQKDGSAIVVPVAENSPLMANQHVEV